MEPLKIGLIGAGGFARHTLHPALHLAPVAVQAVCDMDEARGTAAAGKFGTGRYYADHHEMWEKEDLEALVICMGPGPRQALVLEALAAGYHVFVPKPPASTVADTEKLAEAAARAGKTMQVNFQRRFSHASRQAKTIMATDDFGDLTQLFCSFCSGAYASREHYLLDFAIHHFDLCRHLGGNVRRVSSMENMTGGQGSFAVSLEFESGAVGLLQLNSQRLWGRNYDRIELTGQGSYLVADDLWTIRHYTADGNTFTENYSDERNGELSGDGHSLTEFVTAVREGREPIASIADGVETMRLYEAVLAAPSGIVTL
ncbi:Gfo/Idh/MocA family oxidoreductase [Candidatus Poribacteria bacterium]|jgi:predicted dehydrogenase|nr:Gfo/Idh/MocA family oxidoreductase [Candidatus Poribacteria bacterium]MBT5535318.1 Gfo/Idh/MocA family oxidoreductase [Candidatus Poribacteria bacterium]MBT5710276.1 Gfo/Idh/MocA family oxidoreductase [Candidatus Poribacteria bacterium]MBT7101448.1 Gfo/Idh/MocA family oxidoreductase [Candidatus Poribacteria bacterium]MBT7807154.1 Gfo/Idh/MocA family oxidoreductase [Candidatus Poribacteria bacterium]